MSGRRDVPEDVRARRRDVPEDVRARAKRYTAAVLAILVRIRDEQGVTQQDLARAVGMRWQAGWSRVERGTVPLRADVLWRACARLGVEAHDVLREAEALLEAEDLLSGRNRLRGEG